MKAILDFNGYFRAGSRYTIKEYSLYVIHDKTHDVVSHYFQVSKPPKSWSKLSLESRNNYKVYFDKFGIGWKTGTHDGTLLRHNFWKTLKNVSGVYVLNRAKRDLLKNFFQSELPFKFIFMNELGFAFKRQMTTECRYHKEPQKNNCANDNALAMIKWLNRVKVNHMKVSQIDINIVIDFNGYFLADEYVIKEYSLYIFRDKDNQIVSKDFQVSKPPMSCHQLDNMTQDSYSTYYDSYGIGWGKGTLDNNSIKSDLRQKLQNSKNIYVRDQTQNELLIFYMNHDFNAVCLADVGLKFDSQTTTECKHHGNPDKNNCANDNVLKMIKWLTTKNNNDFKLISEDKNIIIDFNGYYIADDEFLIKEYSLFMISDETSEVIYNNIEVSMPPFLCHKLDEEEQENYLEYFESHGIDWSTGTREIHSMRKSLQKTLRTAKNIYVKDDLQRRLLSTFLNHDFKPITLTELGLEFEIIKGTNCSNHQQPNGDICAHDNASKMLDLLTQRPLYPIDRPKEDLVLDFNGFFIDDKFIVKEYAWYVVDDKSYQVVLSKLGVAGLPTIFTAEKEKKLENFSSFYDEFGIDWTHMEQFYEKAKYDLHTRLEVSKKVFVINKTKHLLLKNYVESDLSVGFVYLADLGFNFEPTTTISCGNHKDPLKNNCANDNAEKMLDWMINRKQRVSGGLKPLEKHVIVDFNGYNLPDNNFAIKELNAIIANKVSATDSDLYLIVKPPVSYVMGPPVMLIKHYFSFYNIHGIDWKVGETDLERVPEILIDYFKTATHIYVRNTSKQMLLKKYIGDSHNIICLDDLGFKIKPTEGTECKYHKNKNGICAIDYSNTMLQWFRLNISGFLSDDNKVNDENVTESANGDNSSEI